MFNSKLYFNKRISLPNRISVSPMCQYKALNGSPGEWHYHHLRNLIETGAGSLTVESTAVSKVGKITHSDLCLYNHYHYLEHKKLIRYLKRIRNIPIIIQLSHSGRKGSTEIPWKKKNKTLNKKKWQTLAPSSISRAKGWPRPKEMNLKKINEVIKQFENSAKLAFKAGYDGVEIHMAHGYLIHQFCSPISNLRNDQYGLKKKKYKFPIDIIKKIKKIKPKFKIIGARITGTDHLKKGIKLPDAKYLINLLKKEGLNYVCVSSGGIIPITNLKASIGFRFKMASEIKRDCKIITRVSGMINDYKTIHKFLKDSNVDFIAIGRKLIEDKFFLLNEKKLNVNYQLPQYKYCLKN
tara:strand:+ start:305 stop:1360 length:1056 start_codon:yes stop_codon:yes gene_type:complete